MQITYTLYLLVLIFAPLAFGTVELWSICFMEVATLTAASLFFLQRTFYKKHLLTIPGFLPLLLLLIFIVLQLIPLPPIVIQVISPSTFAAYEPVLSLKESIWIPLSIHPKATIQEFFRILSYSLFYFLTIQLLSRRNYLKRTLYTVIGLATAIAFLAILQKVGSPDKIYWIRNVPDNASPFGPWINPNQFAGYMEMMAPLALGLFLFYRPRLVGEESLRSKVVAIFTLPSTNVYMLIGFASCLMALSVFISLCRGGILTITLAFLVFILLYHIKRPRYGRTALVIIACCVVLGVSWFGWETIVAEFNRGINPYGELTDGRFSIWQDSLRIFQSFFLFGTGFGTFIDIYPSYASFAFSGIVDHAHNDYLELLTDGGVIGFSLTACFVLSVLHHGWKKLKVRGDHFAVLTSIGSMTGIIAMLMHSVTDFNMHNGADGLYFFFLCGLLVATVNIRYEYFKTKTLLKTADQNVNAIALSCVTIVCFVTSGIQFGVLRAQNLFNSISDIYVSKHLNPPLQNLILNKLDRSITFDPIEYFYHYRLGELNNTFHNPNALGNFVNAARRNPMKGTTLQQIGLLMQDEEQAQKFLQWGYRRSLDDDISAVTLASYLLQTGKREEATRLMARSLEKSRSFFHDCIKLIDRFQLDREEIHLVLSGSIDNILFYGQTLEDRNDLFEADHYYRAALALLDSQDTHKAQWYTQLIHFFKKFGQEEKAHLILRKAVEKLPDNVGFRLRLGDYYFRSDIKYRAREEYERVLILSPGNRTAQKRLRQMGLRDSYGEIQSKEDT